MALERKDVRFKMDPDWHGALAGVAEADQSDIGEWVERVIVAKLQERIDDATVVAALASRLGIAGRAGERKP